ncbi:MAG: SDR family oxidoreductase [Steroidobacteraceae bacterium]
MGTHASAWRLRGARILLTGASEGIGRALALELARQGARLALAARDATRLESAAQACRALDAEAHALPADLTDPQACDTLVAAAAQRLGGLDVLVNNAGATMWARFDALADLEVFERLLRLNLLAPVRLTHAALPWLLQSRGLVVGVASVAGLTGVPERTAYAASKHALVGFLESLRIELAPRGIDVCIVAPDFVRSETHRRATGADGRPLGASPLEGARIMSAEDCARFAALAIRRRERLAIASWRGRLGYRLKPWMPRLLDAIAARAIRERR